MPPACTRPPPVVRAPYIWPQDGAAAVESNPTNPFPMRPKAMVFEMGVRVRVLLLPPCFALIGVILACFFRPCCSPPAVALALTLAPRPCSPTLCLQPSPSPRASLLPGAAGGERRGGARRGPLAPHAITRAAGTPPCLPAGPRSPVSRIFRGPFPIPFSSKVPGSAHFRRCAFLSRGPNYRPMKRSETPPPTRA